MAAVAVAAGAAGALLGIAAGCQRPVGGQRPIVADYYVAPNGDDAWSGRLPAPSYAGTDGPFATVERARDAIRQAQEAVGVPRPYLVLVRGGVYRLNAPLVFAPKDSGTAVAPITYAAYPGETPVLSGGRAIGGWTKGEGPIWTARVPELLSDQPTRPDAADARSWYFHQLFVNGQRRPRARTPNDDYYRTDGPLPEFENPHAHRQNPKAKMGFRYLQGDLKRWDGLDDVNLYVYHSWTASLHWIKELDEANRIVRFTAPSNWPIGWWDRKQRYHVENCREALDAPGEWYFDRKTRVLHYWPLAGEDLTKARVEAPVLDELVRFEGDPAEGLFVRHIHLRGLSFQHAAWHIPDKGPADGQAAAFLPSAAILARGVEHCAIEACEVAHVGTYGVWLREGSKHNLVLHCHIHDLGAGGVRIGETASPRTQAQAADANVVDNCFIHDGGHVFPAGVGVWIGRSSRNRVAHNEIADFYYTGVSVGWSWGYAPSSASHNAIESNHIHHLGKGVLSDMGGIYTLGVSPGTVLRHNHIHHVHSYAYGGWGLYTDEGSTDILLENNIVHDTKTGGFHQHYGKDNIVQNNIFAFSRQAQIIRSREENHRSFTFRRNIVYCDHDAVLGSNWRNNQYELDYNLYWVTTGEQPDFAGRDFLDWRETGQDQHSILADPLFANPFQYDFRLLTGSPAASIGFQPIDAAQIGLYGDPGWVQAPKQVKRVETLPPIAKPKPLDDGFEATAVGQPAADATTSGEGQGASLRVTDQAAASGRHSLKFTDAPGLDQPWQPHLYYDVRHHTGTVRLGFDVRLEQGASFWHELRSAGHPYQAGPSIRITPKGELIAGGKTVVTVPIGQWVHIEILCRLGRQAPGTYDLTVTLPGQTPRRFAGLACASPAFRRLNWVGFMSMATDATTFYLDNLKLDRLE